MRRSRSIAVTPLARTGGAIFIPLAFIAVAPAAPVPADLRQPLRYFPTQLGATWVYTDPEPFGRPDLSLTVTAVAVKNGATVVTVGEVCGDGEVSHYQTMRLTSGG